MDVLIRVHKQCVVRGYQRCIDPDSTDVKDISTRKEAWALGPIEGGVASGGYVTAV